MEIKSIIVDDDPISTEIIKSYIENMQGLHLLCECSNALDAFQAIQRQNIDLIFLDMEMPKLSGLDFIKTLQQNKRPPKIIIITGSDSYALESYEFDVLDYILKPLFFERFVKAINKYYQWFSANSKIVYGHSAESSGQLMPDEHIYIKENKRVHKIFLKDIQFIESEKNYVKIYTNNKQLTTKGAIAAYEEKLPKDVFLRIHRSYIVSIPHIEVFTATDIEIGGKELPIGRSYKKNVFSSLNYLDEL